MSSQLISNLFVASSTAPVPGWKKDEVENERNFSRSPSVMIMVEGGLLEEITTFVAFCSGSFIPLILGKNEKPGQPSEHDILRQQLPVAHASRPQAMRVDPRNACRSSCSPTGSRTGLGMKRHVTDVSAQCCASQGQSLTQTSQ